MEMLLCYLLVLKVRFDDERDNGFFGFCDFSLFG